MHRFAKVEVNFLDDPRIRAMTRPQVVAYLAVWLMSVEFRMETLTVEMSAPEYIGRKAGVNADVIVRMIRKAITGERPLLKLVVDGDGKPHHNLSWARVDFDGHRNPKNGSPEDLQPISGRSPADLQRISSASPADLQPISSRSPDDLQRISSTSPADLYDRITVCGTTKFHRRLFTYVTTDKNKKKIRKEEEEEEEKRTPSKPRSVRSATPYASVIKAFQEAKGREATTAEKARLQALSLKHGEARVVYAVGQAVEYGAVALAYIAKVAASNGAGQGKSLADAAKKYKYEDEEAK